VVVKRNGRAVSLAAADLHRRHQAQQSEAHHTGVESEAAAQGIGTVVAAMDAPATTATEYILQRNRDQVTSFFSYRGKERSNAQHLIHFRRILSGQAYEEDDISVPGDVVEKAKGAAGRLPTTNGAMLFVTHQRKEVESLGAEQDKKREEEEKKNADKQEMEALEAPMYQQLVRLKYTDDNNKRKATKAEVESEPHRTFPLALGFKTRRQGRRCSSLPEARSD